MLPIFSDLFRLKQILLNLLGNALKFTDNGFIEMGIKIKDENTLMFYVQDSGTGIKPNEQQIIFDRFRQSENNSVTKHPGTGLGLTISKNLTKLLGGIMWVESEYGHGATFYFTLPYKPAAFKNDLNNNYIPSNSNFDWNNKTILVVEDMETSYVLIKEYLRKTNAKFLWAQNGQEAIDFCEANENIDLVLMDIQLPVMNGYVATRKIKEIRNNLPVIAETAYAMINEKNEILQAGCDDYLPKPIKSEDLLKVVSKYIDVKKNSRKAVSS